MHKKTGLTLLCVFCCVVFSPAQDSSKFYFTTAAGALYPVADFSRSYKTSLALNSGIEYKINKSLFTQLVLDFNAVKYSQQVKDSYSDYLFQQTNSSIFLVGLNVGKNFSTHPGSKLFSSIYAGGGYINIGEPRLSVNINTHTVLQLVKRMPGIFAKSGLRIGYKTSSAFLQTIYIDGSYWISNLSIQQSTAQALSIYIGTRFGF
jgi:hypothetical protein